MAVSIIFVCKLGAESAKPKSKDMYSSLESACSAR